MSRFLLKKSPTTSSEEAPPSAAQTKSVTEVLEWNATGTFHISAKITDLKFQVYEVCVLITPSLTLFPNSSTGMSTATSRRLVLSPKAGRGQKVWRLWSGGQQTRGGHVRTIGAGGFGGCGNCVVCHSVWLDRRKFHGDEGTRAVESNCR